MVKWCKDEGVAIIPGCVTPTEIECALKHGLNILKFFPASLFGGVKGCKALNSPYRMVKFIPTGGVDIENLAEYANKPYIHAIGGGWLCSASAIRAKKFDSITDTVKNSINTLLGFEMGHIGVNAENAHESMNIACMFAKCFGFSVMTGNSLIYSSPDIEVMKEKGKGEKRPHCNKDQQYKQGGILFE